MSKLSRYIAIAIVAIILLASGFFIVLMNSATVQDRVVGRAISSQLAAAQDDFGGDKLEIVFCGVASPMGGAGARGTAQSCIAVFAGDRFFLVDTGARSADKAVALGLPMGRLDAVMLTHFHSDHIAALGEMHLNSWVRGRAQKLDVYGGPGVARVVDGFNMAYGLDYTYRTGHHGEDFVPSKNAGLVARPIKADSVIYDRDGLKVSAITVSHPPIEPALAFRFDYKGRSLLISGDTVKDDNLIAAAKNVDVLAHEVLQPDMVNAVAGALDTAGLATLGKILHDTLDYHTTPVQAAEAANEAGADLLVFYHYAPVPQNRVMDRMFMRGVADVRDTGVLAARDGSRIALPVNSTSIKIFD